MEVKFRAWHPALKKMLTVYVIDMTQDAYGKYYERCKGYYGENHQVTFKYDDVEWMQSIGKEDATHELICEADIIDLNQTVNGQSRFYIKSLLPLDVRYAYDISRKYEYDMINLLDDCDEYIIIGNIHQNPELLNQNI